MEIMVGSDYRGFGLKRQILELLSITDYGVYDLGTFDPELKEDYNIAASAVARAVREQPGSMGILICDSAHGMCMQANRFKGIRAANCGSAGSAELARVHDDANVLCLSARLTGPETAKEITKVFLETEFAPLERRVRRVNLLDEGHDYDIFY